MGRDNRSKQLLLLQYNCDLGQHTASNRKRQSQDVNFDLRVAFLSPRATFTRVIKKGRREISRDGFYTQTECGGEAERDSRGRIFS